LAIVYAINGAGFSYYQMFESILSIIYHRRYQLPEFKTVVPQKEDLDKYVGTYYSSEFDVHVDFTQKNNRLFLKPAGCYPITLLDAYDNRTFKSAEGSVTYEFHPDKNEVTVHQVKGSFIMVKQTESESKKLE
jgi:D-alanyl-D-alanine carboxypeptidase